jgi:hypothetical protein
MAEPQPGPASDWQARNADEALSAQESNRTMQINTSDEARKRAISSIKRHFAENMDERIGNVAADALLGYFLEEIGPVVYNRPTQRQPLLPPSFFIAQVLKPKSAYGGHQPMTPVTSRTTPSQPQIPIVPLSVRPISTRPMAIRAMRSIPPTLLFMGSSL